MFPAGEGRDNSDEPGIPRPPGRVERPGIGIGSGSWAFFLKKNGILRSIPLEIEKKRKKGKKNFFCINSLLELGGDIEDPPEWVFWLGSGRGRGRGREPIGFITFVGGTVKVSALLTWTSVSPSGRLVNKSAVLASDSFSNWRKHERTGEFGWLIFLFFDWLILRFFLIDWF